MPKLLVIIVTYNAIRWVDRCFDSLRSSSVKPDVFVVDNGSTDGTQKYVQQHFPEVIFQQSAENLGFGRANNLGLQYALDNRYDYVYLLNQDAWIFPDTFETLVDISKRYPEYGIISPLQMNSDLYHIDVNIIQNTCSWYSNKDLLNDMYNNNLSEIYTVGFVMAAHWLIPCSVLRKLGGFSPSFPHYGEDGNYIDRVKWHKFKVGLAPLIKVVHDRGWREEPKKKKLHIRYVTNIMRISNPNVSIFKSSLMALLFTFRNSIELKSFRPYWDGIRIILHITDIIKNRKISVNGNCAFMTLKTE